MYCNVVNMGVYSNTKSLLSLIMPRSLKGKNVTARAVQYLQISGVFSHFCTASILSYSILHNDLKPANWKAVSSPFSSGVSVFATNPVI